MSVLVKGMEIPTSCDECYIREKDTCPLTKTNVTGWGRPLNCPLIELPPHGDLIDRDALIKDGWLCLHKEVIRMGGYAIHELPLKNPSIPVIIEAEEGET